MVLPLDASDLRTVLAQHSHYASAPEAHDAIRFGDVARGRRQGSEYAFGDSATEVSAPGHKGAYNEASLALY